MDLESFLHFRALQRYPHLLKPEGNTVEQETFQKSNTIYGDYDPNFPENSFFKHKYLPISYKMMLAVKKIL